MISPVLINNWLKNNPSVPLYLVFFEGIGLIVIAISTVIAMSFEIVSMFKALKVTLAELPPIKRTN